MDRQMITVHLGHPEVLLPADSDDYEEIQANYQKAGFSFKHLAGSLQDEAAAKKVKTWIMLLDAVARKSAVVMQSEPAIMSRGEN